MLIVTGSVLVKGDQREAALALCLEHVRHSRAEPGCLSHAVHADAEVPERLFFFERWADEAALAAHFALPRCRTFVEQLGQLSAEPPELEVFEACRLTPGSKQSDRL